MFYDNTLTLLKLYHIFTSERYEIRLLNFKKTTTQKVTIRISQGIYSNLQILKDNNRPISNYVKISY